MFLNITLHYGTLRHLLNITEFNRTLTKVKNVKSLYAWVVLTVDQIDSIDGIDGTERIEPTELNDVNVWLLIMPFLIGFEGHSIESLKIGFKYLFSTDFQSILFFTTIPLTFQILSEFLNF